MKYPLWVWSYAWSLQLIQTMEMNMISALIPSMMADLGITITAMGAILGARVIMQLPAAWLAGYLGDKWGRIRWLRCATLIFIAATLLVPMSWDFWSFVVFILFANFAFRVRGGLMMILVAEHAPAEHRGWLVGITNSFAIGATLGPLVASWSVSSELGWRFPFFLLIIPATINLIQSFFVRESERFLELQKTRQAMKRGKLVAEANLKYAVNLEEDKRSTLRQLFGKDIRKTVILYAIYQSCSMIFWSNGSSYWTTFFPAEKGVTYVESLTIFGLLWAMAEPGFLTGSFLSQVTGRNQMMRIGYTLGTVGSFIMVQFAYGYTQVLLTSAIMMFGAGLVYGSNPAYSTEIFPTRIRTMIGPWNSTVSSIMQLITLPLMPICANIFGWSTTYQLFVTTAAFICVVVLFHLPKPNPKAELEEVAK